MLTFFCKSSRSCQITTFGHRGDITTHNKCSQHNHKNQHGNIGELVFNVRIHKKLFLPSVGCIGLLLCLRDKAQYVSCRQGLQTLEQILLGVYMLYIFCEMF